mmetsp:Transcript_31288/g.71576  ORF Transcript_31288/g.71576 Transcript_31288/m.71576 type:complete len:439 (-) Transcript_31288:2267-3583(-)
MSSNIAIIVPPITSVLSTADVASRNATLPSLPVAPVAKTLPVIAERNQTPVFGCTAPVVAPVPTVTMATVAKATPRTSSTSSGARTGSGSQNENTGRWTAEEHRLFLKGLEEHGKGWKKIASLIKSRTVVQIRTHAQKYFQKLAKARQNGEEGEVTMEGRNAFPHSKKRRQSNGSKRKGVTSIVQSIMKENSLLDPKKTKSTSQSVGPVLSPYLSPMIEPNFMSSSVLEDSLHRFLTPLNMAGDIPSQQQNDAQVSSWSDQNKVTNPNNITLPALKAPRAVASGESSPTGVTEFAFSTKEQPVWFSRGVDVDELLVEADSLDWLCDTGGDDTYNYDVKALSSCNADVSFGTHPAPDNSEVGSHKISLQMRSNKRSVDDMISMSISDFDLIDSPAKRSKTLSATEALNETSGSDNFTDFDSNFDEQAFLTALLEGGNEN